MTPILYACHFGGGPFTRLAKVLEWTAARHCPLWERHVELIDNHSLRAQHDAYADNTHKLDHWHAFVQRLPDGAQLLLIDADTAILQPLDSVWDQEFDVAYTVRPPSYRLPLNAGVVFLRVNPRSRAFMARWAEANRRMVSDRALHLLWRRKFGGINQAALGCVLTGPPKGTVIATLPCVEWNCEDGSWGDYSPTTTRILHVKSLLRRVVLNLSGPTPAVRAVAKVWRALEREAGGLPT